MDKLAAIEAFVATVKENGFSPAARKMGVATSSVTRLVNNLERELGTTLLNRSTRRVVLTAAGEVFYEQARYVLQNLHHAEDTVRDLDSAARGRLRISMPVALGRLCIMPILHQLVKTYPDITLDLQLSDEPIDIQAHDIDAAIRIGDLPCAGTLVATQLLPQRRHIVGSPQYLKRRGVPQKPADLQQHSCLAYNYGSSVDYWHFAKSDRLDRVEDIPLNPVLRANNSEVLLAAVKQDLGLALLPDWLLKIDIDSGDVVVVLNQYIANPRSMQPAIYIVYPENRRSMKKIRVLVDALKEGI
ncbi:LysR family transcriptional regulator [Exilibacterium tricleocarpae]|uniref:LysR family transcriptional regulator n=1 Tax=Exilibacterium tricleocarpae TaxID=2591008 RepID=A0A545T0R1_9GAMM|nr:LysR family transcriptional regulator [Exilibacterium tricleocarpae]TQV70781.1 LysR family transcriptional regulator [Exilibacterium tricleocarpae]